MNSDRMTVYLSFVKAIDFGCKTDAEKGKLYTAVTHYAFYGKSYTLPEHLSALFELIKPVIDSAKDRKKKRTNVEQSANNVPTNVCGNVEQSANNVPTNVCGNVEQSANNVPTNVCGFSSNDSTSNSISISISNYPTSIDEVIELAERAGCAISKGEAQRYFICRMSADWVDAAGRKIAPSRIGYDLKKWVLNAQKTQAESKQREVKYEPSF